MNVLVVITTVELVLRDHPIGQKYALSRQVVIGNRFNYTVM